jgi:hypothetical protein
LRRGARVLRALRVIAQWPQGETFKIEKDGRFLSNLYIREVMEAKERR